MTSRLPQRGLRLAYFLALAGVLAGVFATLVVMEDRTGSLGWNLAFKAVASDQGVAPAADTLSKLTRVATEGRYTLARFRADPEHPANQNTWDMIIGDPRSDLAEWVRSGYPQFGPGTSATVEAFDPQSTVDLAGDFVLQGSPNDRDRVAAVFERAGYTTRFVDLSDPRPFLLWFIQEPMAPGLIALALLSVLLTVLSALTSVRRYAIGRLHGATTLRLLGRDLVDVFLGFWPAWIFLILGTTALVIWGNGGNQLPLYLTVAAKTALILLSLLIICHATAILITTRVPIHRALTGRSIARGSLPLLLVIRVPALVFALILMFPLVQTRADLEEKNQAITEWRAYPSANFINLSGAQNESAAEAQMPALGALIRAGERSGTIILASSDVLTSVTGELPVFRVNPKFLDSQPLRDDRGTVVVPDPVALTLLIPASRWAERDALVSAAENSRDNTGPPSASPGAPLSVDIQKIRDGQSVFTFTQRASGAFPARLTDTIILVAPTDSGAISDYNLAASASGGGVIVLNRDTLRTQITAAGIGETVRSYEPAGETARVERERTARDLTGAVFGTIAALLVLIGGALGTAEFTTRNRSTELFVQFASGWRFTRRFRRILLAEVILAVAGLGILVAEIARRSQYRSSEPVEPSMLPIFLAGGAVVVLSSGVLIAGLHLFPTRSRRTGGSDD